MAEIEIKENDLIIKIEGLRKIFALKSELTVSLNKILGVTADENGWENKAKFPALKVGGTGAPFYLGGRFLEDGDKIFYDLKKGEEAIVLLLEDDEYSKVVIGVQDAESAVSQIERALQR